MLKKFFIIISFPTHKIFTVETEDKRSTSTFSLHLKTLARVYKRCQGDFLIVWLL